jgi:hypothetical protein
MEEESFYFIIKKNQILKKKTILVLEVVWEYDYDCFFKVFFTREYIKIIFFIFKKVFLTSAHQNYLKILKKY